MTSNTESDKCGASWFMCTTYLVATDYAVTWKILNGETLARCENEIADAVV